MTKGKAVEYLRKLYMMADITDEYGDMDDTTPYETAVDMAIEALKFQEVYDVTINAVNKYYDEHHAQILSWTPCSDRLPDSNGEYLVTIECEGFTCVDTDTYSCYGWKAYGIDSVGCVIAWMPLPKPYQEDKQ